MIYAHQLYSKKCLGIKLFRQTVTPRFCKLMVSSNKGSEAIELQQRLPAWSKLNQKVVFVSIGSLFCLGSLLLVNWTALEDEKRVHSSFEQAFNPTTDMSHYVGRTKLETDLQKILAPREKVRSYRIITGENGNGKTTAVQKVCSEIGHGIIYVNVPEIIELFKFNLAKSFNLNQRAHDMFFHGINEIFFGRPPPRQSKFSNVRADCVIHS
jgi:hypothetical protein